MHKKSLSRLSVIVFLAFSTVTACTISLPSIQTSPSGDKKTDNTVQSSNNSSSVNSNTSSANTTITTGNNETGNLSNKASDANPLGNNNSVVSSPVPSASAVIISSSSPTPTPTASPTSVGGKGSGQLNVLINPNVPTKRTTP